MRSVLQGCARCIPNGTRLQPPPAPIQWLPVTCILRLRSAGSVSGSSAAGNFAYRCVFLRHLYYAVSQTPAQSSRPFCHQQSAERGDGSHKETVPAGDGNSSVRVWRHWANPMALTTGRQKEIANVFWTRRQHPPCRRRAAAVLAPLPGLSAPPGDTPQELLDGFWQALPDMPGIFQFFPGSVLYSVPCLLLGLL